MKVLVVEDEPAISSFIKKGLEENGYEVTPCFDGNSAIKLAERNKFDIVLLDIILPGMNGTEVCHEFRQTLKLETPIIMLTALGTTEDIVEGLHTGADDYLTKPFKFKELLARMTALLRRTEKNLTTKLLSIDDLTMDLDKKKVTRGGQEIKLTAKEFNLLHYMLRNKEKVVSRVDILENVWEVNFDFGTNVIDVYMNYLRKKIDKEREVKLIHTVVGMGYVLRVD